MVGNGVKFLCGLLAAIGLTTPSAFSNEYKDEIERDFSLRSTGQLSVSNARGGVLLRGWALDKIRVQAKRTAIAESEEEANKLFLALDFRYRSDGRQIELSAEYGRGLTIEERLRERKNPRTRMDIVIFAPANLSLQVWAADGSVEIRGWRAPLEVRTMSGAIRIEDVQAPSISLLCPECPVSLREVIGNVRCMAGNREVELVQIRGPQIYVETSSGNQRLGFVEGEQLLISKKGSISGRNLKGRVEFQSQEGAIDIEGEKGFVSGKGGSGSIRVKMSKWESLDKALIETTSGDIRLSLPASFVGELDAWSIYGNTSLTFPMAPLIDPRFYGPAPASHVRGLIGRGGEQLKIYSLRGNIQIEGGS